MRMRLFMVLYAFFFCSMLPAAAQNQQSSAENGRKVVRQTMPVYPEIAKKMGLTGTVRVLVFVAPDGSVKKIQPVGGSPVLIQAAQDAVYKWKFSPAAAESQETIELHFTPQQQ
jgi:TonB family protein